MRIYQITDTHVAPKAHYTRDNFTRLMGFCRQDPPDLLVLSGDLTQEDADANTCEWMADHIPADLPHVVLEGNHDDPDVIERVFTNAIPNSFGAFAIPLDAVDLAFANTGSGHFPDEQLEWLQHRRLRENSVLFTHYPPRRVSGGYMDSNWALANQDAADAALRETRIGHVFCGHYHAAYSGQSHADSYVLHVTPSPAYEVDLASVERQLSRARIPVQVIDVSGAEVRAGVRYLDKQQ